MKDLQKELQENGCDMQMTMERFLNDISFYSDCLRTALYDKAFDKLKVALEKRDVKEAFNQAHTLKGLIANMGIVPIYEEVVKIVEPLRGGSCEGLMDQYGIMMQQVKKYRDIEERHRRSKKQEKHQRR